jgi:nitroreductase
MKECKPSRHCRRGTARQEDSSLDVFEAIRTVLAIRQYKDSPIPEDAVRRIVEAGRLTASSQNKQPWHFIVVRDRQTLQELAELARSGPYIAEAAFAVIVAVEQTRFAVSDASRAIQSMVLTGWEEGIGSNWVGFGGLEAVKERCAIPADMDVLAILPFGYPARAAGRGKKNRKPLAEVASAERYGLPLG